MNAENRDQPGDNSFLSKAPERDSGQNPDRSAPRAPGARAGDMAETADAGQATRAPGMEPGEMAATPDPAGAHGPPRTLESAQRGWPVDGDLVNNTDVTIYILGEPGRDAPWEVRAVAPGGRDDRGFDADFFKLQGQWFKIHGAARIWVSGKEGQYRRSGFHRAARAAEAEACERMLREYLEKGP